MSSQEQILDRAWQHQQAGEIPQAEALCQQMVRANSEDAGAWNLLGILAYQSGKANAALECLERAQSIAPAVGAYRSNRGAVLQALGRLQEAETDYREALRLQPDQAEAHNNLGNLLRDLGRNEDAIASYQRALELRPAYPQALNNLANVYRDLGRLEDAEKHYRRALEVRPDLPDAVRNLGAVLLDQGKTTDALPLIERSPQLYPDDAEGHNVLGAAYMSLNRLSDAEASYQRSLRLRPENAEVRHNLSLLILSKGEFARGWVEYEWRWKLKGAEQPDYQQPLWDGSPLDGRTILLHPEQGQGDLLQFIRYAPLVKARGGTVWFHCPRKLFGLVRTVKGIDRLVPRDTAPPPFDVQAPLMSLPRLVGTTLETIPRTVPYLSADPELMSYWARQLHGVPRVRVGIAWQGNPQYRNDLKRSVPLRQFAPLAQIPGVSLVSLQVGFGTDQIAKCGFPITDLGSRFDASTLLDTAAVVKQLDLVITVDTSLAHLAGALGAPVWVALPFAADWRWMHKRLDSPWYPTMHLCRQRRPGDWDDVFTRLGRELARAVGSNAPLAGPIRSEASPSDETGVAHARTRAQMGDTLHAETICQEIVRANPYDAEAWALLAQLATQAGEDDAALGHLDRAVAAAPSDAHHHDQRCLVLRRLGRLAEAESAGRAAISYDPANAEGHFHLGGVLVDTGRVDEAIALYRRALDLRPDYAEASRHLGRQLRMQGRFEEAVAAARRAVELRPTDAEADNDLGIALAQLGRHQEAEACYRRAVDLRPDYAEAHANLGNLLARLGRYAESEQSYRQALELAPAFAEAYYNLGRALEELRRWPEAELCYRKAIDLKPIFTEAHTNLGNVLRNQGRLPDAAASYQRALECQSTNPIALHSLGALFAARGQHAAGLPYFQRLLQLMPADVEVHCTVANVLGELGRYDEAAAHYQQALGLQPGFVEAMNNYGSMLSAQGKTAEALPLLQRAMEVAPLDAAIHFNYATLLRGLGRSEDSAASLRRAIELRPEFAEAHNNLGGVLRDLGQTEPAAASFRRAIQCRPIFPEALNNLGAALRDLGQREEAERYTRQALEQRPVYPEGLNSLGSILREQGRLDEAEAHYRKAVEQAPNFPDAHNNLGTVLRDRGRLEEAEAAHRRALQLNPNFAEAHSNLGNIYKELSRFDEAEACYRQALLLRPGNPDFLSNLGGLLSDLGRVDEALPILHRTLELRPHFAEAHFNLGNTLRFMGRFDEAEQHYDRALGLKPDSADMHLNRAQLHLLLGNYARGWPELEWRLKLKECTLPKFTQPRWDGSPLHGRTILLWPEGGLGDNLQFVRYVALVKARGGTVRLACPPRLANILRRTPGVDEIAVQESEFHPFDVYAPLMTLPLIFGTTVDTIPAQVPYVFADPTLVEYWRGVLGGMPGVKVGIAWQGNPRYAEDRQRSVPLEFFEPLARIPGVRLISLQKGIGAEQVAALGGRFPLLNWGPELDEASGPFQDTAALMHCLDLVISVDSALVHLAGALGARTWLPQVLAPHWAWMLNRDVSPWYPSVRLFRQQRRGDWSDVFTRMAQELASAVRR